MTFVKTLLCGLLVLALLRAVVLGDVALALVAIAAWTPIAFWWGLSMRVRR